MNPLKKNMNSDKIEINIIRLDKTLPLPKYHTPGAVAFDLYARLNLTIQPKNIILVPTNLIIQVPINYMLLVAARSSTPLKKSLMMVNGIGIIDQDFCGPTDELQLPLYNLTDHEIVIQRGERLGQAVLVKIAKAKLQEVQEITKISRGGFGHTGT